MNTRHLIAVVAASILSTAALAEPVSGLNSGDPVSVSPRAESPVAQTVSSDEKRDAQRDAIRAEARAAIQDKLRNPARIAEYNFGPSSTQSAFKSEPAATVSVAQH